VHSFGAMTADLLALNDWLNLQRVEQVAMESTGIYWQPVFNVLEADHDLIVVNAQHMKAVPGHKTDVKDAEWLADLLRHGFLRASFIPPAPIRAWRELTRYRQTRVRERTGGGQPAAQAPAGALTSSWARWRPTSWARVGVTCWRRS